MRLLTVSHFRTSLCNPEVICNQLWKTKQYVWKNHKSFSLSIPTYSVRYDSKTTMALFRLHRWYMKLYIYIFKIIQVTYEKFRKHQSDAYLNWKCTMLHEMDPNRARNKIHILRHFRTTTTHWKPRGPAIWAAWLAYGWYSFWTWRSARRILLHLPTVIVSARSNMIPLKRKYKYQCFILIS